jgi:hypothetical protein
MRLKKWQITLLGLVGLLWASHLHAQVPASSDTAEYFRLLPSLADLPPGSAQLLQT